MSHRMTFGIYSRVSRVVCTIFRLETNLNFNSYLTVVRSFTLHSTTNLLKANKAIPTLFFMMSSRRNWSRLTEVKSTHMHSILNTNIYKRRGEKKTSRKKCQIFASVMYSSYHAGVSPEGGLEVGQTLWLFARKLIYSGAKWRLTICILKSNPIKIIVW